MERRLPVKACARWPRTLSGPQHALCDQQHALWGQQHDMWGLPQSMLRRARILWSQQHGLCDQQHALCDQQHALCGQQHDMWGAPRSLLRLAQGLCGQQHDMWRPPQSPFAGENRPPERLRQSKRRPQATDGMPPGVVQSAKSRRARCRVRTCDFLRVKQALYH